jgi:hypothetical protein
MICSRIDFLVERDLEETLLTFLSQRTHQPGKSELLLNGQ